MKIVIANQLGGFRVSNEALKELARRAGIDCYFYEMCVEGDWRRVDSDINSSIGIPFSCNFGKRVDKLDFSKYIRFDEEELKTNPILIEMIEELGSEFCSGYLSRLSVCERQEKQLRFFKKLYWIGIDYFPGNKNFLRFFC